MGEVFLIRKHFLRSVDKTESEAFINLRKCALLQKDKPDII